ncbi:MULTISPECIES: MFS transporter [Serratia]|uniref:MFS transporter n=1 Tax=Serratia TaxID=613 RepID=UPI001D4C02FE|nr:hypothetical protein SM14VA4_17520 [Serratia marcescens]CAF2690885.1 putative transporter [Serratia marcescens]CAH5256578.1 putative transporter [Serratia marcescens]CAI1631392.1 Arabinose efflux permease [Serratia marcescens]
MSTTGTNGAPSTNVVFLLAAGAGLSVASIYYSQPMLGMMGADFHAGVADAGMVPTLTQLGYALGILLLAPLGDRYDRRRIILIKGALLTLTLLLCAFAASFPLLLLSSLAIGLTATVAQDIIPAAALGSRILASAGWPGVVALATAAGAVALWIRCGRKTARVAA